MIYRVIIFLLFVSALLSCSKTTDNIIWERSFGQGRALCVQATGDSGFVSGGELAGKQYLVYLDENRAVKTEYKSHDQGIITSLWTGEGYFIIAGSSDRMMRLSKIDTEGTLVWDSLFVTSFNIHHTSLCYLGSGNFLAVGSADPDSVTATAGLSFVSFDTWGTVSSLTNKTFDAFVAANSAAADNEGYIYLALTRPGSGGKLKSSVAKFDNVLQKLWEKEIYNNPSLGSASLDLVLDDSDNPVVAGRTEIQVNTGMDYNAFVTRYMFAGDSLTKKYLEYTNSATSVISDGTGQYMVLNSQCLIVSILDNDLNVVGTIRTYSTCDVKKNDVAGSSLDLDISGNIIIAGASNGNFYLVIKSSQDMSPV